MNHLDPATIATGAALASATVYQLGPIFDATRRIGRHIWRRRPRWRY